MSVDGWANDDDTPRGYAYQPGLALVETDDLFEPEENWQARALCHGLEDTFDLVDDPDERAGRPGPLTRNTNKYKLRAARSLCFECPVFQQCWDEAFEKLPLGVIQAGAQLSTGIAKVRERRLLEAYALRQEHVLDKEKKNVKPPRPRRHRHCAGTGPAATRPERRAENVRP